MEVLGLAVTIHMDIDPCSCRIHAEAKVVARTGLAFLSVDLKLNHLIPEPRVFHGFQGFSGHEHEACATPVDLLKASGFPR